MANDTIEKRTAENKTGALYDNKVVHLSSQKAAQNLKDAAAEQFGEEE